ncbi:MAG TPA: T9SS type A sorting domain-containing protein, partial [candidate division WOR-3 bacterium]|nr:T9SS type A sorting domain-containing protein [candidate division WOR-3 bacterium]
ATPYGTYPSLPLDEDKLPPNFNGTLLNIEGYKTNEDNIFYLFDSSTDDPFWESIPCGLVNHDSTIFYFGFPLYYIETDSVKSLLSYIIENTVNRKEKNYLTPGKQKVDFVVKGKKLFYNIDNPQPRLNLKIELYNVLGQRVLQKSSQRPKGIIKLEKYKCGIYFAIIKLNNTTHRKKIILID